MSATSMELRWSVLIEDPEYWPAEALERVDRSHAYSCEDYVRAELRDVMAEAGQHYIDNHPELFRLQELI